MWWIALAAAAALADDEPIEIPAPDPLPTVVGDDVVPIPDAGALPSAFEAFVDGKRPVVRNRFGLRPIVSLVLATRDPVGAGARLGGAFVHHWWTVPPRGIAWSGETILSGAGVVGGVRGWDTELSHTAGPWLGPVSVRVGPMLRGDRVNLPGRGDLMRDALVLGARVALTADTGPVVVLASATPAWGVAGDRAPGPLAGVTELEVGGGLAGRIRLGPVFRALVGAVGEVRWTAIGPLVETNLVLHLSVGAP